MKTRGLSESFLDVIHRAQSFKSGQCVEAVYIDFLGASTFLEVSRMPQRADS